MKRCTSCGSTTNTTPCKYCGWPPQANIGTRTCPNCGHIGCHNICPSCKWKLPKVKPHCIQVLENRKPKVKVDRYAPTPEARHRIRARERYAEKKAGAGDLTT
jgi:hypothetical protein